MRFVCCAALLGALAGSAGQCLAQAAAKTPRVAVLQSDTPAGAKQRDDAFTQRLAALGRSEGINLVVERRYAEGDVSRLPALAEELVQGKPDVIFAPTRLATEAFLKLTRLAALDSIRSTTAPQWWKPAG